MTMMGLDRDHDVFYGEPPPSWQPAFDLLALFLGFTAQGCEALDWPTLRFRVHALWKAAILGRIAFAPWAMIHTFTVMSAPGFILMHAAWPMAACMALAALLVTNPVARLIGPWPGRHKRHDRKRRQP
jgi:hypothetical protein